MTVGIDLIEIKNVEKKIQENSGFLEITNDSNILVGI